MFCLVSIFVSADCHSILTFCDLSLLTNLHSNHSLYSGQTGSGKTYTMLHEKRGLYVLAAQDIFARLPSHPVALVAMVSFFEIYQGQLYDLLNNRKRLHAREDGNQQVCIQGIREHRVQDVEGLMQIFQQGNSSRSTGKLCAPGCPAESLLACLGAFKDLIWR